MSKSNALLPFCYLVAIILMSTTPSCDVDDDSPQLLPVTRTVELDFSNPNDSGGEVGYRYYFNGGDYPANYVSWTEWSCETGPDYFGAWTGTNLSVWIGACEEIDLTSFSLTIDGQAFQPTSVEPLADAHETTYELLLPQEAIDLIYIYDHQQGVTRILVNFNQL
jgi:hypothetical protein